MLELYLDNYRFKAIYIGFRKISFRRRVVKRKGFSDNPVIIA